MATNPFDDMTLGEVEEMIKLCLNGKQIQDADPLSLAGAVMFMVRRREDAALDWATFKTQTKMSDIKAFSIQIEADNLDPINATTN